MSTDRNLATLRDAAARWNSGDLEGYLALYDPEAILQGYAGVEPRHYHPRVPRRQVHSAMELRRLSGVAPAAESASIAVATSSPNKGMPIVRWTYGG